MATSPRLEDQINAVDAAYQASQTTTAVPADNSGVRTSTTAAASSTATAPASAASVTAPPNASAAPGKTTYTGLCAALNAWQKALVTTGQREIPDQYEIQFQPAGVIGNATISKPGGTVQKNTSMNLDSSAKNKLDPATNSVNSNSYTVPITAGTQIVQFIDEVIKSSSYITDQASIVIDKLTGKMKPSANTKNGQVAWYKVNVAATPLGYDKVIKDQAYKMTFLITPYALSEMQSEYFPQTNFRGLHKSYNYWFTGKNTQILHFEQDYNFLFRQVFTARIAPGAAQSSDSRDFYQRTWAVASGESSKGAENAANEVGANAADWLYSKTDLANIKLKIVGDPAWLQQGEITQGVNPSNFTFKPFLDDGTINFDSSQICFDVSWNAPTDYNFNTGIADVNVNNVNKATTNLPQENFTYMFVECTSTFNKGRFEQELVGKLIVNPTQKKTSTATTVPASNVTATGTATTDNAGVRDPNVAGGTETDASTTTTPQSSTPASSLETSTGSLPQPLPSAVPTAPTSNGDITPATSLQQQIQNVATATGTATTPLTADQIAIQQLGQRLNPSVNSTTQNMNIET